VSAVQAFVALGSNLGDRRAHLQGAIEALARLPGTRLRRRSKFHETAPVGGPPGQGKYLNAAVELETTLAPRELLARLLELERRAGRERKERDAPRTLDLDLLFHGDTELDEPGLTLPHPRLEERTFVLLPLAELCPDKLLPRSRATVAARLAALLEPARSRSGAFQGEPSP
jgi:2-amino-4-hydroxy-6-hydroxymethyldihydropteridine diphosphokinase